MQNTVSYQQAKRYVERKIRFFLHLTIYLLVNGWIIMHHQQQDTTPAWSYGPLLGWGIGVLFHGLSVFLHAPGAAWKQRLIEQELNKNS